MHIGFVCQYFLPEFAAPAVRIQEFGRTWKEQGHQVSVVTGFPNYPVGRVFEGYEGRRFMREEIDGYRVTRVPHYITESNRALPTFLKYLSVPLGAAVAGRLGKLPRPDVWIATSPPMFIGLAGLSLQKSQRAPLIFEVRDLWPDYFKDLGILSDGPLLRYLYRLERRFYRRADAIVTVADSAVDDLVAKGVPRAKIHSVPNGAELRPQPQWQPRERAAARARHGIPADRWLVGYIGTHGRAQNLHRLADAVRSLSAEGVHFLFVGDGAGKEALAQAVADVADHVTLLPSQPRERLGELYQVCDVCLTPLGDYPIISKALPSKIFEIMAHGRPLVALVRGDAAQIVEQSGAGLVVEPEDCAGLHAAVLRLRDEGAGRLRQRATEAQQYIRENYTRGQMASRYLRVIEEVVALHSGAVGASQAADGRKRG